MTGGQSSANAAILGGVLGPVLLIAIGAIIVVIITVIFVVRVRPLYIVVLLIIGLITDNNFMLIEETESEGSNRRINCKSVGLIK